MRYQATVRVVSSTHDPITCEVESSMTIYDLFFLINEKTSPRFRFARDGDLSGHNCYSLSVVRPELTSGNESTTFLLSTSDSRGRTLGDYGNPTQFELSFRVGRGGGGPPAGVPDPLYFSEEVTHADFDVTDRTNLAPVEEWLKEHVGQDGSSAFGIGALGSLQNDDPLECLRFRVYRKSGSVVGCFSQRVQSGFRVGYALDRRLYLRACEDLRGELGSVGFAGQKFACIPHPDYSDAISTTAKAFGDALNESHEIPCYQFVLPSNVELPVTPPVVVVEGEEFVVRKLVSDDVPWVAICWPYTQKNGESYLYGCVERLPSCGVVRVSDNKVVAFAITHSNKTIGALHVEPDCRRKGFAQIVMNSISSQMRELDFHVVSAQTLVGNAAAIRMFEKLGWIQARELVNWVFY